MNAEIDREWESWTVEWRAGGEALEPPAKADVRRKARFHTVGLALLTAGEALFSIAALSFVTWWAWREPGGPTVAIALAVFLLLAVVWVYALWNRRGTWRPAIASTREFVEISRLRAQRKLRTIRWLPYFVLFEVLLAAPLAFWRSASDPEGLARYQETWLPRFGLVALFLLVIWLGLAWWRRRVLSEIEELEELREAIEAGGARPRNT